MGKADKIIEALAQKLPSSASRHTVIEALRAAALAVPASAAKTRQRLVEGEADFADAIEEKLACRLTLEAVDKAQPAEQAGSRRQPQHAAFDDLKARPLAERAARCLSLIRMQSAARCSAILEAFSATLSSDKPISEHDFDQCLRILPMISTLLDPADKPPAWYSFSCFLLAAPSRLKEANKSKKQEFGERVGGLLTLCTGNLEMQTIVKDTLFSLDCSEPETLTAVCPGMFRAIHHGFVATSQKSETPTNLTHDGLLVLLLAFRFLSQCNTAKLGTATDLAKLQQALVHSITHLRLDGNPQWKEGLSQFVEMHVGGAEKAALKRKLSRVGKKRVDSAQTVAEALAASPQTPVDALVGLVNKVCPVEAEAQMVKRAAVARAAGALFYEDSGTAKPESDDLLFFEDTAGKSMSSTAESMFAKDAASIGIETMPGLKDLRNADQDPDDNTVEMDEESVLKEIPHAGGEDQAVNPGKRKEVLPEGTGAAKKRLRGKKSMSSSGKA
eukprot:gnl/MRDRNA2_/MRDRNA2_113565_c0_seq1.p1 gnl/MRDRNA2_/MRDRNA2_113565_c0~~gnl/MRDRNA2_/MRDRNA2_113565_c0_seq1.p1  ORF type:complete len:502 (+),score=110.28 gnl/MRDRNA2_/MRDRNA2_113565_c0_seq1:96-1601(+)